MRHYIGVDFHMQHSSVAVMDSKGNIERECKLYHNDEEELRSFFGSFGKDTSVSIEATRNWYWFIDLLQEMGLSPKLVHAKKVRVIAESTIKTDKVDARTLAHLDRCNFLPLSYIADKETRSARELLRYRMALVKVQTSVKNRVHAVLAKNNIHQGYSDLFGKSGLEFLQGLKLSVMFRLELDGYLRVLGNLKEEIKEVEKIIRKQCSVSDYAKRLMTMPGISYFTGLLLACEIADIDRFGTYKKLCCYAGLASSTSQTGDTTHHGHIIKDSNRYIRYALIEAVPYAVRKDYRLGSLYHSLMRKKGKGKAKIVVARKLLTSIYFMLRDKTDYICNKKRTYRVNPLKKLGA